MLFRSLMFDVNSDGWLDVAVVNFGHANELFINNGAGVFTESGSTRGFSDSGNAEGATLADVNGDGVIDSFDMTDLFDILGMCREDLDDSGSIDFNDLLNVLVNFGNTCE